MKLFPFLMNPLVSTMGEKRRVRLSRMFEKRRDRNRRRNRIAAESRRKNRVY